MSQSLSSKPEPKKSQSNWSYQAYFLAQRQRQTSIAEDSSTPSTSDMTHLHADAEEKHRNQVVAQMEELAASIDVRLTIIR